MKYGVTVSFTTQGYVEVEADNIDEAIEKAQEAIDNDTIEISNEYDEPDYDFGVEELED